MPTLCLHTGSCTSGYTSCGDFCLPNSLRCNGLQNCPDGRDEVNCPRGSPKTHSGSKARPAIDYDMFTEIQPARGSPTASSPGDENRDDAAKGAN